MSASATVVKGIIFDLDGTLYRMPWHMKPLLFARLLPHGLRLGAYMAVRRSVAGQDFGSGQALMAAMGERLGRASGITAEQAHAWIVGPFYASFIALMGLLRDSRPGLTQMLQTLGQRGLRLGVLSDFNRVRGRLERLGLDLALFDAVGSSEEYGCLKPGPRPFLQMAERFGLAPAQVLVIGDRDDTDGAGARAAGMQFLRLRDGRGKGMRWSRLRQHLEELPAVR